MKLSILLLLILTTPVSAQTLQAGDSPPEFKPWKWLKGKPVNQFQKGKIYLVEFGSTWCKPCIAAIPEMSALAEKHEDVTVISCFVMEQMNKGTGAYGDNVVKYVTKRKDQMNYTVALDDAEGNVQDAWIKNIGQTGIPFMVVIDRNGKVAWTGYSVREAEGVIGGLE